MNPDKDLGFFLGKTTVVFLKSGSVSLLTKRVVKRFAVFSERRKERQRILERKM